MATFSKRFIARFGIDNNGQSITNLGTSGASLTRSGAHDLTLTTSATTNATIPSGTVTLVDTSTAQTLGTKTLGSSGSDTTTIASQLSANGGVGAAGQVLTSRGANLSPEWTTVSSGGGTTTYALTIGTGLSGTSFNGSAAVTIAIDSTVATLTGTQTLSNKTISGASNTLSNIGNDSLTNSSITIGTTPISLGASSTTLTGLTSVTSTNFVGTLTGNASTATNLVNDYPFLRDRGNITESNVNSATSNGFYALVKTGHSSSLLTWNAGGSTGPVQIDVDYYDQIRYRNQIDSVTWTAWKTLLHSSNFNTYSPTLSGVGATGTWSIGISGNASTATKLQTARTIGDVVFDGSVNMLPARIAYRDSRTSDHGPYSLPGVTLHLKTNTTDGLTYDGGTFHGVLHLQHWDDQSGGKSSQLAFTDGGNIHFRQSQTATTWGSWNKIWHSNNDGASSGLDADLLDGQHGSYYAPNASLSNYLALVGGTMAGDINLNNFNLNGVSKLTINDPGPTEGIEFAGGNIWRIYESGNDLTGEVAGNLHIVQDATRRATFNTSGQLDIPVPTGTAPLVVSSTTRVANLNVATAGTADTLTTPRTINGTSFNGSADITTGNWGTARTITIGATGKSVNGSGDVAWTLNEIGAETLHTFGVPRSNLGNPTVREMALFDGQFTNKTEFYDINNVFFETSTDNVTWTPYSVSDSDKRRLFNGDLNFSALTIPYGTPYFRIRLRAGTEYMWLNALYAYWSTSYHTTQVQIYKKHDNGALTQHTSSTTQIGPGAPNHMYLPFYTIPFHPNGALGTHYHEIMILFIPTWNSASVAQGVGIALQKMQIWGGFPYGKRNLYSTSEFGDATFPAKISTSSQFITAVPTGTAPLVVSSTTRVANLNVATAGTAETADTLTTARTINGTSFNGSTNITTSNWGTARTITIGATGKSVNGSENVAWSVSEIGAETLHTSGVPRGNLGNPTVREMALFDAQFNNKTEFFDINNVFAETSTDNVTWTPYTVSDSNKRRLLNGDTSFSGLTIPYGTPYFRIRLRASSYVFLDALYAYWTTFQHTAQVQIYRKNDNGPLIQHTSSTTAIGPAWPGHLYLPFSTIQFTPGATGLQFSAESNEVMVLFIPTWNPAYSSYNIEIGKMQIWGGYPYGKRNLYSTNEFGDASFPASISTPAAFVSTVATGTAPLVVSSTTRVANLNVATAGTAETADTLTTARTINGTSFNGSANITITANTTNALTIGTGLTGTSFNGSSAVTIAIDSTVATLSGTQTLTNKTLGGVILGTSGSDTTTIVSQLSANGGVGTSGQVLTSRGANLSPEWTTVSGSGITINDDTSTNATRYLAFTDQTSGTETTLNVASTKLTYNPSTGALSSTDFNSTSDAKLKKNIVPAKGLEVVNKLNGYEFDFIDNGMHASGVIAQEIEEVLPHLVKDNIDHKTVAYMQIIPYLIESIKELSQEVNTLKTKLGYK